MLYRELSTLCSKIHTEHTNTLLGKNIEIQVLNLLLYTVIIGFYSTNAINRTTCS